MPYSTAYARICFLGLCLAVVPCIAEESSKAVDMLAGGDLKQWVAEGKSERKDGKPVWTLNDGVLHCAGQGYGFLRYDTKVDDFVWTLEYRMKKGCNSGLGIRHEKYTGGRTRPSYSGYELQLLDDAGKKPSTHSTFSLYRYVAPTQNASLPAGEWNQVEVTCKGPHIRVVHNGKTVQDIDQSQIDKIKDKPLSGYLSVQNHGKEIEFRNMKLQQLQ